MCVLTFAGDQALIFELFFNFSYFFLPLSVVAFQYQKKFYKLTSIKFRSAWHNTFLCIWQFFFKTDFSFSVSFMSFHSPCRFATCLKKTGCCSVYTDFFRTGRSSTRLAWGWYGLPYIFFKPDFRIKLLKGVVLSIITFTHFIQPDRGMFYLS